MIFGLRVTFIAALAVATALPASAADKNIPWNIKTAGDFMQAVAGISKDADSLATADTRARNLLGKYDLTEYRQVWRRFSEQLNFLIAHNDSHVFIAFKGTTFTDEDDDAHTVLNKDFRPDWEFGHRVHHGWWVASEKAFDREIKPVLEEHGEGRKILITGTSMGGAIAAYVTQQALRDRDTRDLPVRLVTFATPRYTLSRNFFPRRGAWYDEDFYVYTVEATKKNRCVDLKVYEWQRGLRRKYPVTLGRVDLKTPKNKRGDNVWFGRCKTDETSYDAVHSSDVYHDISQGPVCEHIALRSDCKTYRDYVD
jgi:hypothetical protein